LRISGISYDVPGQFFKLRLAWLSQEPMASEAMLKLGAGWKVRG